MIIPPDVALFAPRLVVPAGHWKVEMPRLVKYYPDVIDKSNLPG